MQTKIFIGCDHAGFQTKLALIEFIKSTFPHFIVEDLGTHSPERTDYTLYAKNVAQNVVTSNESSNNFGILICGSGIGISIAANKHKGVRAAVIYNVAVAKLARQHNNANIICLGARMFSQSQIHEMMQEFFTAKFEGGVHLQRIENIEKI